MMFLYDRSIKPKSCKQLLAEAKAEAAEALANFHDVAGKINNMHIPRGVSLSKGDYRRG